MRIKYFVFFFSLYMFFVGKLLAHKTEECQVSLLTVVPSSEAVYTVYGHSALRLYFSKKNIDIVYNWGTFNFKTKYFLYRFLQGKVNYFLSSCNYDSFLQIYRLKHRTVTEQILSISSDGKKRILREISQNMQPENRKYCYNILKDNCTTRIRDLIEKSLNNTLDDSIKPNSKTFRQWIHEYTELYRWMTFGIDLLIGCEADQPISNRKALFLPMNLKKQFSHFENNSGTHLVISSIDILKFPNQKIANHSSFVISPSQIGWILFCFYGLLLVTIGFFLFLKKSSNFFKMLRIANDSFSFLFFVCMFLGSFILFFVLFSSHPCTSSNWNLLWLHPFHLIAFVGCFLKQLPLWIIGYHFGNVLLLILLLIGKSWLPQVLNPEIIPYIICLITASFFCLTKEKILKLYENNG